MKFIYFSPEPQNRSDRNLHKSENNTLKLNNKRFSTCNHKSKSISKKVIIQVVYLNNVIIFVSKTKIWHTICNLISKRDTTNLEAKLWYRDLLNRFSERYTDKNFHEKTQ